MSTKKSAIVDSKTLSEILPEPEEGVLEDCVSSLAFFQHLYRKFPKLVVRHSDLMMLPASIDGVAVLVMEPKTRK